MLGPRVRSHWDDPRRPARWAVATWPTLVAALFLVVQALLSPVGLSGQTISGILIETGSDRPVQGLITLLTLDGDSVVSVLTDFGGHFRLTSPEPGEFMLAASALAYESTVSQDVFMLPRGGSLKVEFRIAPRAIQIAGITVSAESPLFRVPPLVRNGFMSRAQRGYGRFISPAEIQESQGATIGSLLARVGRVTTELSGSTGRAEERIGKQGMAFRGIESCIPVVYIDGIIVSLEDTPLDDIVPVASLWAAEIYKSRSEAPQRFSGGMGLKDCEVIVLWTRYR